MLHCFLSEGKAYPGREGRYPYGFKDRDNKRRFAGTRRCTAGGTGEVEAVLHIQLQEYEVQKKTTEITVHDGSSLGMVRKFIATKRLEGKSEKTLRKYQPELEKLVAFLDKKIV